MRVVLASEPGTPGWPNEDFAAVAPGAAVLLDGCTTVPRDKDIGCVHSVAWYARTLGSVLLSMITSDPPAPLTESLAAAIADVRGRHEDTCDLSNPATPASTVTAARVAVAGIEVLALSDSVIMADYGADRHPLVITDTHRSVSTNPDAARNAYTATLPGDGLRGIALLSDGATRITDSYDVLSWPVMLAITRDEGPAQLIRQLRAAEASDPDRIRWPRDKNSDDATIIYWHHPVG